MAENDIKFSGAVPDIYDRFMVPMIFEPYAADMAARVAALNPASVLETAAGSGVVTRVLAPLLSAEARYVVSDLNPPMLERAKLRQPADERLEWSAADALDLPFPDESFAVVLCQFGVMFFPSRVKGYGEAKRVLQPGGTFLFNAWGSLADNLVAEAVYEATSAIYPANPPDFFPRVPHGYHDEGRIRADLLAAGFGDVTVEVLTKESHAPDARHAAVALCQGTPLRMEIVGRDPDSLAAVTDRVEAHLVARFGKGPVVAKMQAVVVTAKV